MPDIQTAPAPDAPKARKTTDYMVLLRTTLRRYVTTIVQEGNPNPLNTPSSQDKYEDVEAWIELGPYPGPEAKAKKAALNERPDLQKRAATDDPPVLVAVPRWEPKPAKLRQRDPVFEL